MRLATQFVKIRRSARNLRDELGLLAVVARVVLFATGGLLAALLVYQAVVYAPVVTAMLALWMMFIVAFAHWISK